LQEAVQKEALDKGMVIMKNSKDDAEQRSENFKRYERLHY
jgi:hypothetical protein